MPVPDSAAAGPLVQNNTPIPDIELRWSSLSYSVSVVKRERLRIVDRSTLQVLDNITGYIRSGQVLGIMGASGSGKTTLLNILAQRLHAGRGSTQSGELLLNGKPFDRRTSHNIAFVSQHQSMFPTLSADEQLGMTAILSRQPLHRRDALIDELGLAQVRKQRVGNEVVRGLSGGERRRVAIGLALIRPVPLLLLDEPTSGLDAFTSLTVVQKLRSLARAGHAVILTIHQPRTDIFDLLDLILVLAHGQTAFFGPTADAVGFFESLGYQCPDGVNYADFLIDTASVDERTDNLESSRARVAQIVAAYADSAHAACAATQGARLPQGPTTLSEPGEDTVPDGGTGPGEDIGPILVDPHGKDAGPADQGLHKRQDMVSTSMSMVPEQLSFRDHSGQAAEAGLSSFAVGLLPEPRRAAWVVQVGLIMWRSMLNYIRNPATFVGQVVRTAAMLVILSLLYFRTGTTLDQTSVQNIPGVLFFMLLSNVFPLIFTTLLSFYGNERAAFLRERAAGLYGPCTFFIGKQLGELPVQLILPTFYVTVLYFVLALTMSFTHYLLFLVFFILMEQAIYGFGLAFAILLPSVEVATSFVPILLIFMILSAGFFVTAGSFGGFWAVAQRFSPLRYAFEGFMINQFRGITISCTDAQLRESGGVCPVVSGDQVLGRFGFDTSPIWYSALSLIAQVVGYKMLALLSLIFRARSIKEH